MQPVMSSTRPCPACSHQDHPAETIIPFLPLFHSLFPCISGLRYVGKLRSLCIKNSAIRVSSEKPRNRLSAVKISFLSRHLQPNTRCTRLASRTESERASKKCLLPSRLGERGKPTKASSLLRRRRGRAPRGKLRRRNQRCCSPLTPPLLQPLCRQERL